VRLLILLYPWLELWSLIQLGVETSALFAVFWVFLMFMLGGALLRRTGMASVMRLREAQATGVLRQQVLLDDMSTGFAALLFIVPGLISDFIALLVLIGPVRRGLARWITGGSANSVEDPLRSPRDTSPRSSVTLEGDFHRVDEHRVDDASEDNPKP
jgi:UPF0716 protein FxsA